MHLNLLCFVLLFVIASSGQDVPITCTDCSCSNPVVICVNVCDICDCTDVSGILDCSFRKLNGSFSQEPLKWPKTSNYSTLDLEHNFIGRVVRFPPLDIKVLNLRYNLIVAVDSLAFINLKKLEEVDLSENELAYMAPEVFQGEYSPTAYEPVFIKSLNLSYNQFKSLDQNLFEHLPELTRLVLKGNPLAGENGKLSKNTVTAIASVPNLEVLDLSETELSSLPPTFLKNLPKLKELVLTKNKFSTLPSNELSFAESLQIIHLDYNPIEIISSYHPFPNLSSVTQLHISHMPELKRIEKNSLSGLTGLKYLACSYNEKLDFISSETLSPATNLTKLDLHDNSLHYLPQDLVKHWDKIKSIEIRGNRWSCDCDNQWMIKILIPLMADAEGLVCSQPEQMLGASMKKLSERGYNMRCLDLYGNHPERDGSFLIASFSIVIIALVIIAALLLYRKGLWRKPRGTDYTAIYQQHMRDDYDRT